MDWDEIERGWNELKGDVKRRWTKLTDEDVDFVKGKYAELLGLLQERYGHAKEQAEREINDWAKRLKVDIAAELTALGNDVASLRASVGELVRRQAAATAGLGHPPPTAKPKLEAKPSHGTPTVAIHVSDLVPLPDHLGVVDPAPANRHRASYRLDPARLVARRSGGGR